jgi:predicted metal-binding membrane protein
MQISPRATAPSAPASLPRADRVWISASLIAIATLSWLYLLMLDHEMSAMQIDSAMTSAINSAMKTVMQPMAKPWSAVDFALTFAMWWVMMTGMMLPSALPMVEMFARINRNKREKGKPYVPAMVFAAGYLLAWGIYSLAATGAEWTLESLALMSPMGAVNSPAFGGMVFIAAGIYQFTPLKQACLRHCRSPLSFILNSWRDGSTGALQMGASHGFYCLGCCWILMLLLFAVGVMNLLWVAIIAVLVLLEKLLPAGVGVARLSGAVMCAWGVFLIASA